MKDSMLNTQKIKSLQQKVASYQAALVTLKNGHTTEALLRMQSELDDLKIQVSQCEILKENGDSTQQNNRYGIDVMKQLKCIKISIEDMNAEISTILNQLSQSKATSLARQSGETIPHTQKSIEESKKSAHFENRPTNIPTFNDLQRIAGKTFISNDTPQNKPLPLQQNNEEIMLLDKHFNEQYFRGTETFPNHIYNILYKNKEKKPAMRFKNVVEKEEDLIEKEGNAVTAIEESSEKQDSPLSHIIESSINDFSTNKDDIGSTQVTEKSEINEQQLSSEQKKEKSNSIFNIFKKWSKFDGS